jgi:hypothetical protein
MHRSGTFPSIKGGLQEFNEFSRGFREQIGIYGTEPFEEIGFEKFLWTIILTASDS